MAACLLAAGPAAAAGVDDDLAVVKRAVSAAERAEVGPVAATPAPAPPPRAAREAPDWLRVRLVEHGEDGASLSLNVPLALVRAIGEACDDGEDGDGGTGFDLSDLLGELSSGEPLVSIDGDDARIRVWVE